MGIERLGKRAVQVGRARVLRQGQPELIQGAEQKTGRDAGGRCRQILAEHRIAGEDPHLRDGLIGAAIDQLRRAVGTEHDERDAALARLDHRWVEVGHRGARGGDQGHRTAAALGQSQGQEAKTTFIEVAVTAQASVLAGGQGQWRAARAGGKAEIAQTEAPQLLDDQAGPTQAQVVARLHHGRDP